MEKKIVKIVIVGDSNVGKSAIINAYRGGEFYEDGYVTIGVDFDTRNVEVGDSSYQVNIWDTAGQEKYRTIVSNYYRNVSIVMAVFDLSNIGEIHRIEYWISDVERVIDRDTFNIVIVGNKSDSYEPTEKELSMINNLAKKHSATFYIASAKENKGISELFSESIRYAVRAGFYHTKPAIPGKRPMIKYCC